MMRRALLLSFLGFACAAPHAVELSAPPGPATPTEPVPLHVIPVLDGMPDPLVVSGSGVALTGVAPALAETVRAACLDWATRHRAARPGGWEMRIALGQGTATATATDTTVELSVLVTLSAAEGQRYLAQTRAYCRERTRAQEAPARAAYACLASLSHDIAGWLEGVSP